MDSIKVDDKYRSYSSLAFEYNVAAMMLWNSIADSPYLFNPFMFLARHTIELLLKGLIVKDCANDNNHMIKQGEKLVAMSATHRLSDLWDHYLSYSQGNQISIFSSQNREEVSTIIREIEKTDLTSTNYRYPFRRDGSRLVLEPVNIGKTTDPSTEINSNPPLISISNNSVQIIRQGKRNLLLGKNVVGVIDTLFEMIEE